MVVDAEGDHVEDVVAVKLRVVDLRVGGWVMGRWGGGGWVDDGRLGGWVMNWKKCDVEAWRSL